MNISDIKHNLKTNLPDFRAGDTVRVMVKVVEGDNERLQAFDGVVIARKGAGIGETFTVRKVSFGVGVERIFPVHSPRVEKIEVLRSGKVNRSKLNFLKDLSGKAARLKEVAKKANMDETLVAKQEEPAVVEADAAAPAPEVKAETKTETK